MTLEIMEQLQQHAIDRFGPEDQIGRMRFIQGAEAAWDLAIKHERERCVGLIAEQRKCYSEDIFTPIKPNEPDPIIRDRVSAQMARHVLDWAVEAILSPLEDRA